MMKKKIMVAGHLCVDITPVFPEGHVRSLEQLFVPGKLLETEAANIHTGGAVANTGLALKKLGAGVKLVGKVGNDSFGKMVKEILDQYGAGQDVLMDEKDSTSYTIVLAPPGIDRIFLHNRGANDSFCADDITDKMLEDVSLLHFGYPPLVKRMYENGGQEMIKLFQRVREREIAVSLDLVMVDSESEAGRVDWKKYLGDVLPYVDFFVPSIEELCYMLDNDVYENWLERAAGKDVTEILSLEKDIRPLAEKAMQLGAKILFLKCGSKGIYYRTASTELVKKIPSKVNIDTGLWSNQEGFQPSFLPERVRSGAGAGDSSIAAFLFAMQKGYSIEHCVRLAAAEGASCVEEFDALSGVKTLEELARKIEAGWRYSDISDVR